MEPEHLPRFEQRAHCPGASPGQVSRSGNYTLLMHPAKIKPKTLETPTNHDAGAVLNCSITSIAARPSASAFPFEQGR